MTSSQLTRALFGDCTGTFGNDRGNASLEEALLAKRSAFHLIVVCSAFLLIKENTELRLYFFRENIVEMKRCQTMLLH